MRRLLLLVALAASAPACATIADLKRGDLSVPPSVIQEAGAMDDPTLDGPLNMILDTRVAGGLTAMDEPRTVAAIQAQARRNCRSAIVRLEDLVFDASDEVRIQSLAALELLDSVDSLPVIAEVAVSPEREEVAETAYQVFSRISRTQVNYLDRKKLEDVLAAHGASVRGANMRGANGAR